MDAAIEPVDDSLQSQYETTEGSEPHPEVKHEPRTIVRSRNDGLVQMMTEIDDGVFVAWMKCSGCSKDVQDCTCKAGPQMPAYIEKWRDDRFDKSLRWGTKLMKQAEEMRQGWTLIEIRGGGPEHDNSDNVTVLEVDWDEIGDEWTYASGILDQLDEVGDRFPDKDVERIAAVIEEIWPDEVAERRGDGEGEDEDEDDAESESTELTTEPADPAVSDASPKTRELSDEERNSDVGF